MAAIYEDMKNYVTFPCLFNANELKFNLFYSNYLIYTAAHQKVQEHRSRLEKFRVN